MYDANVELLMQIRQPPGHAKNYIKYLFPIENSTPLTKTESKRADERIITDHDRDEVELDRW